MNAVPPADAGLVTTHTGWGIPFLPEMDATDGMNAQSLAGFIVNCMIAMHLT